MNKLDWISDNLEELKSQSLFINVKTIESPMGPKIKVDGRWVLNFCSNNFVLGPVPIHPDFNVSITSFISNFDIFLNNFGIWFRI